MLAPVIHSSDFCYSSSSLQLRIAAPAAPIVTEEAIEAIVMRVTGTYRFYTVSLLFSYCRLYVFDAVARR